MAALTSVNQTIANRRNSSDQDNALLNTYRMTTCAMATTSMDAHRAIAMGKRNPTQRSQKP